ncbi:Ubiquitin-conjugating enzyme E2 D1 [Coelomomyces lativittatus]|nr:Ubiquitin-conjugating enzyme E2 D1 [Coelomomyces lativittatus]KAJ1508377.1 Ubiquitin-conjugating enzyme E2 D1 [Coelomomyces lativittatus]
MALRRIQKELSDLSKCPVPGISIGPSSENDLLHWQGVLVGPPQTTFEGGSFKFNMTFLEEFPFRPPQIQFQTRIYHPNIDDKGALCLALLKTENWKPATKLSEVFYALLNLVAEPNPDDPMSTSIAEEYRNQRSTFERKAKEWVKSYAKG